MYDRYYDDEIDNAVQAYIRDIEQYPLLTPEEERTLGERAARGDEDAKQRLITGNLRWVIDIAKQYHHAGFALLDLIQEGNIGLMRAVDKFDYTKGYRFTTYATWWIKQAITRAIQERGTLIHVPSHMQTKAKREAHAWQLFQVMSPLSIDQEMTDDGATLADYLESPEDMEEDVQAQELAALVEQALDRCLDPRHADMLRRMYGLEDDVEHTLEEVGKEYSRTRERIRQIRVKAFERLRPVLQKAVAG